MSKKEQVILLLDKVPEYKIDYVLAYMQGLTADEDDDNIYCENIVAEYLRSDKHDTISFDQALKEAGLTINDLQN